MNTPRRSPFFVKAAITVVLLVYVLIAGVSERQPFYRSLSYHFYGLQAQALLSGQFALPVEPRPELLQLTNPYDPLQNQPYRLQDIPLYHGKYYLFHGLTPVVLLFAPYQFLVGEPLSHAMANALFCGIGFLLAVNMLNRILTMQSLTVPAWLHAVCVLLLGFAGGTLNLLRRPEVYQVACAAAYCCAMVCLWFLFQAIVQPKRQKLFLAASSLAVALTLGARPNYLFFALVPCGIAFWLGWKNKQAILTLFLTALPIGIILLSIGLYNWARFDDPLEFGMRYQLASVDLRHTTFLKLEYVPLNIWCYLLALPQLALTAHFPFVTCSLREFCFYDGKDFHGLEQLCSLLGGTPIYGALILLPLVWNRMRPPARQWFGAVAAALVLNLGYLLIFNTAAVRYMADFQPLAGLLLAGTLLLAYEYFSEPKPRFVYSALIIALAGYSIYISFIAHLQTPPTI